MTKELVWDAEMRWATFIDDNGAGCWWEDDRCRGLVPLCQNPFYTPNSSQITCRAVMLARFQSFMELNTVSFSVGLFQSCMAVWMCVCVWGRGCLVLESVFAGYLCCTAQLGLVVFGTLMKRDGDKTSLFSYLKALSVSLGFQSVLSAECKMVVWNLLCRLCGIGRSLFFSRCLAQGRGVSTICTLLAMYFLLKWKKPIDVDLIGPSVTQRFISCYMSISLLTDICRLWSVTLIWKSATTAYL